MIEIEEFQETLSQHGYEYERFLGKGSFSNVFLCKSTKYNQRFAIKRAIKKKIIDYEYNTMISLNHPNIIKLYDAFEDENAHYLVMEYCPNGTIRQKGKLSYEEFVHYAKQVLEAISYCHSQNVAHRDIKPDNIFLDQYDQIKLADFGFAKQFEFDSKSEEKCGSLRFMAPEMLICQSICPFKADIWALGITFFFMATGSFPFQSKTKDELKQLIFLGQLDFDEYHMNHKIRYLISKMAAKNINLRAEPESLLKLPLFRKKEKKKYRRSLNIKSLIYSKDMNHHMGNASIIIPKPEAFIKVNSFKIIEHSTTKRSHNNYRHNTF